MKSFLLLVITLSSMTSFAQMVSDGAPVPPKKLALYKRLAVKQIGDRTREFTCDKFNHSDPELSLGLNRYVAVTDINLATKVSVSDLSQPTLVFEYQPYDFRIIQIAIFTDDTKKLVLSYGIEEFEKQSVNEGTLSKPDIKVKFVKIYSNSCRFL